MQTALQRHLTPTVLGAAALASLAAGMLVGSSPQQAALLMLALAGLGWLALLVALRPETLFLGWLFLAPIFQASAEESPYSFGRPMVIAFYTLPAFILTVATLLRRRRDVVLSPIDYIPAAFLAYVLVTALLTSNALQSTPKIMFETTILGPVLYYFLRAGPGSRIPVERIVGVLLWAAVIQGVLGLIGAANGWNPWNDLHWQVFPHEDIARPVATLANPAVLGMFLGTAIVFSVALLSWNGPRALRRPAILVLVVCIPALFATLTRAPILATVVAIALVLLAGSWRFFSLAGIVALVLVVAAMLPSISGSELYEERVVTRGSVSARAELQDWSLRLAAQSPVVGHGFGSFDDVKNESGFDAKGLNISLVLGPPSHNSFLTVLVETGAIGLILFALPFAVIGFRGALRTRIPSPDRWLVGSLTASLLIFVLTAMTLELRFFSFAQVLPYVLLALLASALAKKPAA